MSTFGITRQDDECDPCTADAYQTHFYPFDTFPTMKSHVHPNFVLLHLSRLLFDRDQDPYIKNLLRTNKHIAKVARLAVAWCSPHIPSASKYDETFVTLRVPERKKYEVSTGESGNLEFGGEEQKVDDHYDPNSQGSDGDSVCTPPRRVWYPTPERLRFSASAAKRHP